MTKTVKALKEEYPNEMCSGNIRDVPLKVSRIIHYKLEAKLKNKRKNPLRIEGYSGR